MKLTTVRYWQRLIGLPHLNLLIHYIQKAIWGRGDGDAVSLVNLSSALSPSCSGSKSAGESFRFVDYVHLALLTHWSFLWLTFVQGWIDYGSGTQRLAADSLLATCKSNEPGSIPPAENKQIPLWGCQIQRTHHLLWGWWAEARINTPFKTKIFQFFLSAFQRDICASKKNSHLNKVARRLITCKLTLCLRLYLQCVYLSPERFCNYSTWLTNT